MGYTQKRIPFKHHLTTMKLLILCVILASVANAQYLYEITFQTYGPFDEQRGTIFIQLQSPHQINNVSMSQEPWSIVAYKNYDTIVNLNVSSTSFTHVSWMWVNEGPHYGIRAGQIKVIPRCLQEPYRSHATRKFYGDGLTFPFQVSHMGEY